MTQPKLVGATSRELLEQLKAPEDWTRHLAKRGARRARPREVGEALAAFLKTATDEHDRLEALWAYQSIDAVRAPAAHRTAAAPRTSTSAPPPRASSPSGQAAAPTRSARSKRGSPTSTRGSGSRRSARCKEIPDRVDRDRLRVLDKPMDRFLDYALWLASNDLKAAWLPAFEAGKLTFGDSKAHEASRSSP